MKNPLRPLKKKYNQLYTKTQKGHFSFAALNAAQFLGALNDNIYKLLVIFFLLSILGLDKANQILAAAGALYVIPFLLFSSAAGILADRFSKQKLILVLKGVEILTMLLAFLAFYTKSPWGCYSLLFLLATHSALFGPSKYGILPEIVEKEELTRANSQLVGLTYLAIIIGTFLASFLTEKTQGNFIIATSFCLLFSIFGFISALAIRKTPAQKSPKKMSIFFVQEIMQTLKECRKIPLLLPSLFGSAYFLFIGAFTQLNIIPFAIQSLHLSEYMGGYLFLLTALGIAGGSLVAGKFFKHKMSLSTSCVSGAVLSLLFFAISTFNSFLYPTMIFLVLLGIFGGVFVIAFDTFIQIHSPDGKRGQTIAAANFFSFLGVLIASFCLYIFGNLLGLSAASGFFCVGVITLISTAFLTLQTLEVFFPFLAKKISQKNITILDPAQSLKNMDLFVIERWDWKILWLIARSCSRYHLLICSSRNVCLKILSFFTPNFHIINSNTETEEALALARKLQTEGVSVCLVLNRVFSREKEKRLIPFFSFREESFCLVKIHSKDSESFITVENV